MTKTDIEIKGDWRIEVSVAGRKGKVTLDVTPPAICEVTSEPCLPMPVFKPKAAGWLKGYRLQGVRTGETTAKGLLVPESLELRAGDQPGSPLLRRTGDYEVDWDWGTLGWVAEAAGQSERAAFATYSYGPSRIDSVVACPDGRIAIRQGEPHVAVPQPPELPAGETRLANLWLPGRLTKLGPDNLFPILETQYPAPPPGREARAATELPRTYAKLRAGEPLRILAWGDSVTDASYLPDPSQRWQEQFARRLGEKFPQAKIALLTEAWGGRNTASYLDQPPGALHNFKEKVLAVKPDLIVSEFVNDSWMTAEQVANRYGQLLADFQGIGAEWLILTPHYMLPEWMGLTHQRDIDADPRKYVQAVRAFAAANHVALADASLRWGRLWRQGVPFMTLMLNAINHPDVRGMRLFADSLMEFF